MRSAARLILLAAAPFAAVPAHEIISTKLTWTAEVSRIFYRRCVVCHRKGGPAPMSLLTYDQVRPWAKAIKVQVLERKMPPWGPVKGYGDFRDDASLSQDEIAVISSWVEGGAPKGDPKFLDFSAIPRDFEAPAETPTREWFLADGIGTRRAVRAVGIRVRAAAGAVEARAQTPDGAAVPLVWIPDAAAARPGPFYFREPLELPAGTVFRVFSEPDAEAFLLVEP